MAEESHEARDIIIALLALIWAMLVISYLRFGLETKMTLFLVFGVTIAYFAHEMAHKISAIRSGYDLEFYLPKKWLLLALVLPVVTLGYVFFALLLEARHEKLKGIPFKEYAYKISTPGPLMNIILLIFFTVLFSDPYLRAMGLINAVFAFWNLIPRGTDGENIYLASKGLWAGLVTVLAAFSLANILGVTTAEFISFFTVFSGALFLALIGVFVIIILLGLVGIKIRKH